MSAKTAYLALRLEGPMQAWGFDSQFNRRNTGLYPTKSAILGMCLAALGVRRGSEKEKDLLKRGSALQLLTVAVPRSITFGHKPVELVVRRITDYHTIRAAYDRKDPRQRPHIPVTAEGKLKAENMQAVVTYRQYLCDASFCCVLSGNSKLIGQFAQALENPVWGVWLGRKACIPTAPVLAGVFSRESAALRQLLGDQALSAFSHQRDVGRFEDGSDSLPDRPLCFAAPDGVRKFAPRRVKFQEGKG